MDAILLQMQQMLILSRSKTGGMTRFPIKLSRGTVKGQPVVSVSQKLLTGVDKGLYGRSFQSSALEGVTPRDTQSRYSLPDLVKFERLYFQEFLDVQPVSTRRISL